MNSIAYDALSQKIGELAVRVEALSGQVQRRSTEAQASRDAILEQVKSADQRLDAIERRLALEDGRKQGRAEVFSGSWHALRWVAPTGGALVALLTALWMFWRNGGF